MMMARDSEFDPPSLSPEAASSLKEALANCLAGRDVEEVRPALRRVAQEAREKRIFAEQLLITLKDVWYELPEVRQTETEEQQRMLQRIVTLCIREYYGDPA